MPVRPTTVPTHSAPIASVQSTGSPSGRSSAKSTGTTEMIGLEYWVNADVGRRTQPTNVPRGTDLEVIARGDGKSKIIKRSGYQWVATNRCRVACGLPIGTANKRLARTSATG